MPRIARVVRSTGELRWLEITEALVARVWSYIDQRGEDDCWPWKRSRYRAGYGQIRVGGAAGSVFAASRVVYAIIHGEVGSDVVVRHSCDNPPCCNPAHLFGGTTQDNILDAIERGRMTWPTATMVTRRCPSCGQEFTTRKWGGRKLCGRESCTQIHRRRKLERQAREPNGTFGRAT